MSRLRRGARLLALAVGLLAINAAVHFPYAVDAPTTAEEMEKSRRYYAQAFQSALADSLQGGVPPPRAETRYMEVARQAAEDQDIKGQVSRFVAQYGLRSRPVLEVGSGSGSLQDVADDYTGLDISPTVARFYHKKFVLASATALPMADDSFGGGWSIWVLEHIPNPEQALSEIRRVMRDSAVVFLMPAWNVPAWAAQGHDVRPYSDFGLRGKVTKASIPVRSSFVFRAITRVPIRAVRTLASLTGPTRLRYRRRQANYEEFWQPDSDASTAIDRHEVMLWFRSRGDRCLNCAGAAGSVIMRGEPLVIRIHK